MALPLSPVATGALCAPFGLMFGSFANVVIWRVPRHESVVSPPSHCPRCDTPIAARDNVPVLSWLFLRGRCRHCGAAISPRYMFVELAGAALFFLMGARFHDSWALFAYLMLAFALLALTVIDLDHFLLPNRVVYPSAAVIAPLLVVGAAASHDWGALTRAALGAAIAFAAFYAIWFAAGGKAMGFGDVRLAALLGACLAYLGWGVLAAGLFLPFLFGSIGGVVVAAPRLLGPMAAAAVAGALAGPRLARVYFPDMTVGATRARVGAAFVLAVLVGSVLYMVLWRLRRIERGRHVPFGPYLALGALVAILAW